MKNNGLLAIALAFLMGAAAYAAPNQTAANTAINNTATVTFDDPNNPGTDTTTNSNPVTTTVQQVYGFTITPDGTAAAPAAANTKTQEANANVVYTYLVKNTSNGPDTINLTTFQPTVGDNFDLTNVVIYKDVNNNGTYEPGIDNVAITSVALTQDLTTTTTSQAYVFVVGKIPSTQVAGNTSLLDLQGQSQGNPPTNDTGNYAKVTVIAPSLSLAKTARTLDGTGPAVRDASGATAQPGDVIEYTLKLSNAGAAPAKKVRIGDPLNPNTTFVSLSATTTIAIATGITSNTVLYSVNGTTWSTTAPTAATVTPAGIWVGVDTNGDNTITVADVVPATSTDVITVIYSVKVK